MIKSVKCQMATTKHWKQEKREKNTTRGVNKNYRCLGGAAVRRRTRDRKVAGSTPSRGAIKSTQPSIPPG